MNVPQASLSQSMFDRYGPLLTLVQLAQMLHRSPDGMRMALREPTTYAERLNAAKVRIGRRIYFRTPEVAEILQGSD
ncbi:DNA-binding protein [Pseudomarimonas arenosa]|uniref:DNA-binding protein n=1 Tax=Pseudomarimonas arenosa TaxID=2774145 RepID=A0AAW3ZL30_9GAMM|nr:DNA-binding protein [Pseudomarimonas arenosa]MBD8526219.1 DNA-binding protein [Pseudomarimonas arenosa]